MCSTQKIQTLTLNCTICQKHCHTKNILTNTTKGLIDLLTYFNPLRFLAHISTTLWPMNLKLHEASLYQVSLKSHAKHVSLGTCRLAYLPFGWISGLNTYNAHNPKPRVYMRVPLFYLLHSCFAINRTIHWKVQLIRVHCYSHIIITTSNLRDKPPLKHWQAL